MTVTKCGICKTTIGIATVLTRKHYPNHLCKKCISEASKYADMKTSQDMYKYLRKFGRNLILCNNIDCHVFCSDNCNEPIIRMSSECINKIMLISWSYYFDEFIQNKYKKK